MPGGDPAERPGKRAHTLRVVSYVVSGLGVAMWIVYLVLKHNQQREVPWLLWAALAMVVVGFAVRRSQQST